MSEMGIVEIADARIRVEWRLRKNGWNDAKVYSFLSWLVETRFPKQGLIAHSEMEAIERDLERLTEEFRARESDKR